MRVGMSGYATLIYKKGQISVDLKMDKYGTNTNTYRRHLLYSSFLFYTEAL